MNRVVSFGELMMRLSPPGQERLFQSPTLRTWFGGSEANTAVSLAHFGIASRFVTRLPSNALGDAALSALRAEGIDTSGIARGGDRLGLYFVESGAELRPMRVVYDRAQSAFATLASDSFSWSLLLADASWFHVSGVTPALGAEPAKAALDACTAARAKGVPISVDLNYRPALWIGRDPRPTMQALAHGCDVLIGNASAIDAMLGIALPGDSDGTDTATRALVERVVTETGCKQVILTQRDVLSASEHRWSAVLYDAPTASLLHSRSYQVRVVDRVGGGDSFTAAFLWARFAGRALADMLAFATTASAIKLTIPGDFNRVSVDEVDRVLTSHP